MNDLKMTERMSLSRCSIDGMDNETTRVTFHGCGDASKHAYCAMIYLVLETSVGSYTKASCGKTRVAPVKEVTIPMLELMSARILVNLM